MHTLPKNRKKRGVEKGTRLGVEILFLCQQAAEASKANEKIFSI